MNLTKTSDVLEATSLALNNTQNDPTIGARMEAYGLSAAAIQTGKRLLKTLEQKTIIQDKLQQKRWALSQQINASLLATRDQFKEHAQLSLVAFRHDTALIHALKIERIASRRWECVRQAAYFYQEFRNRKLSLAPLGVSPKDIQRIHDNVTELLRLKEDRVYKKGISEQNTQEKNQAQAELREWLLEFRAIARAAFRHQPQLLEMFGMKVGARV